jgi:hypothetical protein
VNQSIRQLAAYRDQKKKKKKKNRRIWKLEAWGVAKFCDEVCKPGIKDSSVL